VAAGRRSACRLERREISPQELINDLGKEDNCTSNEIPSPSPDDTRISSYAEIVSPLARNIAKHLLDCIVQQQSNLSNPINLSKHQVDVIRKSLLDIAEFCRLVSAAYAAVPKQLLINSASNHSCLVSPVLNAKTTNKTMTKQRAFHFTAFPRHSYHNDTDVLHTGREASSLIGTDTTAVASGQSATANKLWQDWREHFMRRANSVNDCRKACPPGRLGLLMPVSLPPAGDAAARFVLSFKGDSY
jgi:hypothetical protein